MHLHMLFTCPQNEITFLHISQILCCTVCWCVQNIKFDSLSLTTVHYREKKPRYIGVVGRICSNRNGNETTDHLQPFNGLTDWSDRFESISEINGWDEASKKLWVRVSMTGWAATAYKRLTAETRATHEATTKALKKRFEPDSKQNVYMAELNSRTSEDWATFGKDLRTLAEKAYPDLEGEAQELLALLQCIEDPQLAFVVRQKQPETVDEAVQATLELHLYLPRPKAAVPHDLVNAISTEDSDNKGRSEVVAATTVPKKGNNFEMLKRMEADIKSLKQSQAPEGGFRGERRHMPWDRLYAGSVESKATLPGGVRPDSNKNSSRKTTNPCSNEPRCRG